MAMMGQMGQRSSKLEIPPTHTPSVGQRHPCRPPQSDSCGGVGSSSTPVAKRAWVQIRRRNGRGGVGVPRKGSDRGGHDA